MLDDVHHKSRYQVVTLRLVAAANFRSPSFGRKTTSKEDGVSSAIAAQKYWKPALRSLTPDKKLNRSLTVLLSPHSWTKLRR